MGKVIICDHPLIQHKLTKMRDRDTKAHEFRLLLDEISMLMGYELTRSLPVVKVDVHTPVDVAQGVALAGKSIALIPILRAGLGMTEGLLRLYPAAKLGHVGLFRDETTLQPVQYYAKLPAHMEQRQAIVIDPMLATGGSAIAAINLLKEQGCPLIRMMCLVAAPQGVAALHEAHGDVDLYVASVDRHLNELGYIVPGLGDAGDRLYGTD